MLRSDFLKQFAPDSPEFRFHQRFSAVVYSYDGDDDRNLGVALIEFLEHYDVQFSDGYQLRNDEVCDSPYEFSELVAARFSSVSADSSWWVANWRSVRGRVDGKSVAAWKSLFAAHPEVLSVLGPDR